MPAKVTGEWLRCVGNGNVPPGRSSQSVSVVDRKIYVFGGEHTPRVPLDNNLFIYDLDEKCWSICDATGEAPCPRIAHAAAVVDSYIYIFGGRTGITMDEGSLNDMHRFNTVDQKWEVVQCGGSVPMGRSYHAMTTIGKSIYLFGGCTAAGRANDLHVFDTTTAHWSALPSYDAILPRGGPGFVSVGDCLFVVAGFTGEEADDMYCYNTVTGVWSEIKPHPNIPRISVFGLAVVGSIILLHGGEVSPSDAGHAGAGQYSDVTYAYDTSSGDRGWVEVSVSGDTPPHRGWHASATLGNGVVVHGGNSPNNLRLDDMFVLTLNILA